MSDEDLRKIIKDMALRIELLENTKVIVTCADSMTISPRLEGGEHFLTVAIHGMNLIKTSVAQTQLKVYIRELKDGIWVLEECGKPFASHFRSQNSENHIEVRIPGKFKNLIEPRKITEMGKNLTKKVKILEYSTINDKYFTIKFCLKEAYIQMPLV